MIGLERWRDAQTLERSYWYPTETDVMLARRAEERARTEWIAELLHITPESVEWRRVIDIGGGPQPIVGWPSLPLAQRIVVDPMPVSADDITQASTVLRLTEPAEYFLGKPVDECWGYNVLQHVIDPAKVLATAMAHADVVRWFEWIDQPASVVHPHVVTVETFAPLASWHRVLWIEGVRDEGRGWTQAYAAGVWERPT